MSVSEPVIARNSADSVVRWRTKRLRAAGLPQELAQRIAVDRRYDLHALLELVDRGCPGDLAVRILAPLDEQEPPC
jgi:hypothetical protein